MTPHTLTPERVEELKALLAKRDRAQVRYTELCRAIDPPIAALDMARRAFETACRDLGAASTDALPALLASAADELRAALARIERWELPPSGRTWDDGSPMSFGAAWGSNGERDFMRGIARAALSAAARTTTTDPPATATATATAQEGEG
jgi:hypothetical protein